MWKGKGRSGYGESSTGGDYDDWSCLSRNGRQWKNPSTMLTRDLSGADYWHIRKQITDSYDVPLEVYAENDTVNLAHTLPNGKANLLAYADRPTPVKSKVSIKDKIIPQLRRLNTLRSQMIELEREYKDKTKGMSIEDYSLLREVIVVKINRAEVLYQKAISVKAPSYDEEDYSPGEDTAQTWEETYKVSGVYASESCGRREGESVPWVDELPDGNSLKKPLKIACMIVKTAVRWHQAIRNYYSELKVL